MLQRGTKILAGLLLFLMSPLIGSGQEEEHHHHESGTRIGKVHFAVSCSPQAQKQFNVAVAWLHSFEYSEAERAFEGVATTDPQCAMAHWGVAMSLYHELWAPPTRAELEQGASAVARATQIGAKMPRERDYIQAIGEFYQDWEKADYPTRAGRYERAMERVYARYPRDREAGVFYALALNATALAQTPMDKTYAKQKKAAVILNRVLRLEPQHPGVAHYLIHSYDYPPLAHLALAAARSYSNIAPSSAHALHMPSHIFTRLGFWDDDVAMNIRSENAAKEYAKRNHLAGAWDEQLHAMDYLAYAYLQQARDNEARAVLDELKAIRKTDPENFKCAYSFAAIPARWTLERRKWAEAAALKIEPANFPWPRFLWAEAITHFARAIGASRSGNADSARREVAKLAEIQKATAAIKDNYDWATQVEIQRRAASAWLEKTEGRNEKALELMRSAADLEDSTDKHPVTPGAVLPARELLGDLLLELNQPAEALKEYERSMAAAPSRFNSLYGAARAAEIEGNRLRARQFYQRLVSMCSRGEAGRAELQHAREYLKQDLRGQNFRSTPASKSDQAARVSSRMTPIN
jgi:tetratricopeptide (TPR) repeat protein